MGCIGAGFSRPMARAGTAYKVLFFLTLLHLISLLHQWTYGGSWPGRMGFRYRLQGIWGHIPPRPPIVNVWHRDLLIWLIYYQPVSGINEHSRQRPPYCRCSRLSLFWPL